MKCKYKNFVNEQICFWWCIILVYENESAIEKTSGLDLYLEKIPSPEVPRTKAISSKLMRTFL